MSSSHARSISMVYTPWHNTFSYQSKTDDVIKQAFNTFIISSNCLLFPKIAYYKSRTACLYDLKEPTSTFDPSSSLIEDAVNYNDDASDVAALTNMLPCDYDNIKMALGLTYDL